MKLEQVLKTTARGLAIPYETVLKDYAIGHLVVTIATGRRQVPGPAGLNSRKRRPAFMWADRRSSCGAAWRKKRR